ncbi:MAG: DUF433 domain-containing protein [Xenococcaceae cyanobacterium]
MFSTTTLENYFEFLSSNDIRLKGHRIGIDNVLEYYLEGYTPEEILTNLPTLSLEEIYTTITYYLRNRSQIDLYLLGLAEEREKHYQEWTANPSPLVQRLKAEKARRLETKISEK